MTFGKVYVGAGFALLIAALCLVDISGLVPLFLISAAFHELGHFLAVRAAGGEVKSIKLLCTGAVMEIDSRKMTYRAEIYAASAGPAVNLIIAVLSSAAGRASGSDWAYFFSGINLVQAMFNMLTIYCLDGGRILYMGIASVLGIEAAERVSCIVSCAAILLLMSGGTALIISTGRSFTLFIAAIWLFISYIRNLNLFRVVRLSFAAK